MSRFDNGMTAFRSIADRCRFAMGESTPQNEDDVVAFISDKLDDSIRKELPTHGGMRIGFMSPEKREIDKKAVDTTQN